MLDRVEHQTNFDVTKSNILTSLNHKFMLSTILDNFDWRNESKRKIYQNNYDFENI